MAEYATLFAEASTETREQKEDLGQDKWDFWVLSGLVRDLGKVFKFSSTVPGMRLSYCTVYRLSQLLRCRALRTSPEDLRGAECISRKGFSVSCLVHVHEIYSTYPDSARERSSMCSPCPRLPESRKRLHDAGLRIHRHRHCMLSSPLESSLKGI